MPIRMRRMKISDLVHMQQANLNWLAENYHLWLWIYHKLLCPQTSHVATNLKCKIIWYVLGKIDDEYSKLTKTKDIHGGLTSVAVFNSYRKLGIATKLIQYTHRTFCECFHIAYINLNVPDNNHAGHTLLRWRLATNSTVKKKSIMQMEKPDRLLGTHSPKVLWLKKINFIFIIISFKFYSHHSLHFLVPFHSNSCYDIFG